MPKRYDGNRAIQKIQEAIQEQGLTITELSRRSGITRNSIYSAFRRRAMGLDMLIALCDALNLTPDYVLGFWDEE